MLADGSFADPNEVSTDESGNLCHVRGPVAYGPHGPRSRGMSAEEIEGYRTAQAKPEQPKRGYKTREVKVR